MNISVFRLAVIAVALSSALSTGLALPIFTPANADFIDTPLTDNNPNADQIEAYTGSSVQLSLLYKQNVGGAEEGPAQYRSAYHTTFANSATEPEDAIITYVPGLTSISGFGELWLIVKDGADPRWYLFDISTWNGTESLLMENFWVGAGAISYVGIYGGGTPPLQVPDSGSTIVFCAAGLLAVWVGLRRGKRATQV